MNAQQQFFENIRNQFSRATYSLVDDICTILNIEKSTAYKRISGETQLKFEEIQKLCNYYQVSFDNVAFENKPISSFRQELYYKPNSKFIDFLKSFATTFDILRIGNKNMLYILSKELPVFYLFGFPTLIQFAHFSSKHENEGYQFYDQEINFPPIEEDEKKVLKYLSDEYSNHPSTELLSVIMFDSFIERIKIAQITGFIGSQLKNKIIKELLNLIDHMESQCSSGYKINPYTSSQKAQSLFLYNHIQSTGGNEIYYRTDHHEMGFLCNGLTEYLITSSPTYSNYLKEKFVRLKNVSTNITIENSLVRSQFFKEMRERILSV